MLEQILERQLATIELKEAIELECALVAIPSYTTEEQEIARLIGRELKEGGVEVQLQEVPLAGGGSSLNVVGRISGRANGPSLLVFGHMDHSPSLGRQFANYYGWKRQPFTPTVEGDWIYGKGSQDEKGGLCAMILAAKALARDRFSPVGDVYFCGVQGHKRVSSGIWHLLRSGLKVDRAINVENTGNAVVPLWVGISEGSIHVHAPKLHFHRKEQVPELRSRRTAFEQLGRLMAALGPETTAPGADCWLSFQSTPGLERYPQIRIERVTFHRPDYVELTVQVRTVPGQTDGTIRQDLERLVIRLQIEDPHFAAEIEWPTLKSWPPVDVPVTDPLVQALVRSHRLVTGEEPDVGPSSRLGAAADASHVVEHLGVPAVLYGPGGGNSDLDWARKVAFGELEPDERIRASEILTAAKVYVAAIVNLCGAPLGQS